MVIVLEALKRSRAATVLSTVYYINIMLDIPIRASLDDGVEKESAKGNNSMKLSLQNGNIYGKFVFNLICPCKVEDMSLNGRYFLTHDQCFSVNYPIAFLRSLSIDCIAPSLSCIDEVKIWSGQQLLRNDVKKRHWINESYERIVDYNLSLVCLVLKEVAILSLRYVLIISFWKVISIIV